MTYRIVELFTPESGKSFRSASYEVVSGVAVSAMVAYSQTAHERLSTHIEDLVISLLTSLKHNMNNCYTLNLNNDIVSTNKTMAWLIPRGSTSWPMQESSLRTTTCSLFAAPVEQLFSRASIPVPRKGLEYVLVCFVFVVSSIYCVQRKMVL